MTQNFKYQGKCECGKPAHHKGYCKGEGGYQHVRTEKSEIIDLDEIKEDEDL